MSKTMNTARSLFCTLYSQGRIFFPTPIKTRTTPTANPVNKFVFIINCTICQQQ